MIHYHGTPIGGTRDEVARFVANRHMFVPFPRAEDLPIVAEASASFAFDNGAFSAWKRGAKVRWKDYFQWCKEWIRHPGLDFCIIPDVVEGTEAENDKLISKWISFDGWRGEQWHATHYGVPVWHFHESMERLNRLCKGWPRIALGSSGDWPNPGTDGWWRRLGLAMKVICDEKGRPRCKVHGLRMLAMDLFDKIPFASADSTNVAQNNGLLRRFGMYTPPTSSQRAEVIASRIEAVNSPAVWSSETKQLELYE